MKLKFNHVSGKHLQSLCDGVRFYNEILHDAQSVRDK